MTDHASSPYARFPVLETIDIREASDIRRAVDKMVAAYATQESADRFSYRILLPRDQKSTANAKRMGLAFQGEFVFALRKRNIVTKVRDGRYINDESHYGCLLTNSEVYEQIEKG